jgi:hypothetical protein
MQLLTFNEILTKLCDDFEELIAPRKIARSNTNIIYLIFKAIAKGYEIINNVCVTLSNKFNPANCSEEDLVSVASLVGTEKLKGSASGLEINIRNTGLTSVSLFSGIYTYQLDDDTAFQFEIIDSISIASGEAISVIAMSENVGTYPVTTQDEITVTSENNTISSNLKFSCLDNSGLLGTPAETNLAFRERILTDTTRQNTIKELELKLKNLPYLYDAKVVFNNTTDAEAVGSYTLPPFYMLIFFSGSIRNEVAEIVAESAIYPTLSTNESIELKYFSDVFSSGYYPVHVIPFDKLHYVIDVACNIDTTYISIEKARAEIKSFLLSNFRVNIHKDYIKEEEIYNKLKELNVSGINILNIDIKYNNTVVPYLSVPVSDIPYLDDVTFSEE